MLKKINIRNFATIENLEVDFSDNLNILSGETGAGKSIIIESINFLFGRNKGMDILRTGESAGYVSALFEQGGDDTDSDIRSFFEETGINYEPGDDITIKRDVSSSGKSRYFINSEPANKNLALRIGGSLVSIFGQNDKMFLISPESQLAFLDKFAGNGDLLSEVKDIYHKIKVLKSEEESLEKKIKDSSRIKTLNSYLIDDFESLGLRSDEEEKTLKEELERLTNYNVIKDYIFSSIDLIENDESGILKSINALISNLSRLSVSLSSFSKKEELGNAENARILIEDLLMLLNKFSRLQFDEARLEELRSKIDRIIRIENKYGVSTISDLMGLYERAKNECAGEEELESRLRDIRRRIADHAAGYKIIASRLHEKRMHIAPVLEKKIESEASSLKIKPVFRVDLKHRDFENGFFETGQDTCVFMFSANPGEDPRPLSFVASGGELSRLSLCMLKVVNDAPGAGKSSGISYIFDEIDAGIGGEVANYVGRALKGLSANNQVILITHLAQVASFADTHFFVFKEVRDAKTYTRIKELNGEERVREIARMLSGDSRTNASLAHAREILKERGVDA